MRDSAAVSLSRESEGHLLRVRVVALLLAALMIFEMPGALAEPADVTEEPAAPSANVSEEPTAAPTPAAEPTETPAAETEEVSPEPELTALADTTPEPEQAVIQARIAGEGVLELTEAGGDAIALTSDGVFSVDQGSMVQVDAVPEVGSEYVKTVYNGRSVDAGRPTQSGRRLSFVASESGELEVTFAPRHEVQLSLSGSADVSADTGSGEQIMTSGEVISVSDGTTATFRITPKKGSDFDGADYNGKAIAAVKDGNAWTFTLTICESGVLSVRTTMAGTVSTILDHVELLYDNGGTWQAVKEGDNVLSLPGGQTASFAARPFPGCELTTLLVNGESVEGRLRGGSYHFSVGNVRGPIVITAVASEHQEAIQGVDTKTGVRYRLPGSGEADNSNITGDSWISVVELTKGAAYDQAVADARPYGELLSAYDLTLRNGSGVYEPSVPVSVSFPVPDAFREGNLKVLHASGKSISEIPYRTEEIQGVPCVTITVDGFSLYMLVDAPEDPGVLVGEVSGSVTGADGNLTLFLLILGLCLLAILLLFHKRRMAQ